jgi:hypothetical protein
MVLEQNSVPRKTFWPKREKAIQGRAKLDKAPIHELYSSLNRIRAMRWVRHVARARKNRNTYKDLVRKPEWMRSLERHMTRWTLKQNLRNGVGGMDGINLA